MEFKLYKQGWRLFIAVRFGLRRVREVGGRCSHLPDGKHALMWDFDDTDIDDVVLALRHVQLKYDLPAIHILTTGKEGGYHAYCFASRRWEQARAITAGTYCVDKHYLAVAIERGYFTLRYTNLPDRDFHYVTTLRSNFPDECDERELTTRVDYTRRV